LRLADFGLKNSLLVSCSEDFCTVLGEWDLNVADKENRSAVALKFGHGLIVVNTHLDAYSENLRIAQLQRLHEHLSQLSSECRTWWHAAQLLLVGDFNALRRADYSDEEWEELKKRRAAVQIKTTFEVTRELEIGSEPNAESLWQLTDCRAIADEVCGPLMTSMYGVRIDYAWASAGMLAAWRVARVTHEKLPLALTDHALIVCEFSPRIGECADCTDVQEIDDEPMHTSLDVPGGETAEAPSAQSQQGTHNCMTPDNEACELFGASRQPWREGDGPCPLRERISWKRPPTMQ